MYKAPETVSGTETGIGCVSIYNSDHHMFCQNCGKSFTYVILVTPPVSLKQVMVPFF